MELLGRFRRAVNKLTFLLSLHKYLTSSTWQVASLIRSRTPAAITGPLQWRRRRRRAFSFNDRPGLRACVEVIVVDDDDVHCTHTYDVDYDGEEEDNCCRSEGSSNATSPHPLRRTTSYPLEADVDKQAEMFIDNFYKHLVYEKQVSLNLRYCRETSSSTSFNSSIDDAILFPT